MVILSKSVNLHPAEEIRSGTIEGSTSLRTETVDVLWWLARVLKAFWRVKPRTTVVVISATVVARFTSLAAFLLPLKVLLLAGSEGGSRYFGAITDPEVKLAWIIGLSITALALFFVTRFLRALSDSLSDKVSAEVMKEANQLAFFGNQNLIGRRHFTSVTGLCADLLFVALALIVIAIINPPIFAGLAVLFAVQYGFTSLVLDRGRATSGLAVRIRENTEDYLQNLYTINFWLAFLFILVPLLIAAGGSIFIAIVSFILIRQALQTLVKAIGSVVNLAGQKHLIDALTFASHQWKGSESLTRRDFDSLFQKDAHLAKLQSEISGPITVRWKDSSIGGFATFVVTFRTGSTETYYQEQVFTPSMAHLIENEEVLFTYVPRDLVNAPAVRTQFAHGPFKCRLCDYGSGSPAPAATWDACFAALLEKLWSIEPPTALIDAFSKSHTFLHERLTPELVGKLAVAALDEKEAATLQALNAALPTIRATLSEIPLHIWSRDLTRSNTAVRNDGEVSVMIWGRWRLAPMGAYLPRKANRARLAAMLARVRMGRSDIPETLSPDHLRLAAACRQLVVLIEDAKYEAALDAMSVVLSNTTLTSGETRDSSPKLTGNQEANLDLSHSPRDDRQPEKTGAPKAPL